MSTAETPPLCECGYHSLVPWDAQCRQPILIFTSGPDIECVCDLPAGHGGKHRLTHPPGRKSPLWWGKDTDVDVTP